nr:hypothetical protein [Candidatus Levybacteria bacterium]
MAKKRTKSVKKSGFNLDESAVKAVLSLFVLLLAFGVLLIFNTYQENILSSSSLQTFILLTVVFSSLLVGLLFLINPQKRK